MSKSKRLMELMMTVNRKRKFTVKELANEFAVSPRTILRDLQELSELGVPLYSEVGPHGGYQVLRERILPPIAFTEHEAIAIFFAIHALRHYVSLPFEAESASVLSKFYNYMSGDIRDRIDQMKNRVDFVTPARQADSPFLSILLDAAVQQKIVLIDYKAKEGTSCRKIQPLGIYANNGLWYCPAYCFLREDLRVFRCDRIQSAVYDSSDMKPMDLWHIHLGNRKTLARLEEECVDLYVELSKEGVQRSETELCLASLLHIQEDGSGWLQGDFPKSDIPYLARLFIGLGNDATVKNPPELVECMKRMLSELLAKYDAY
ncbi:YafY family transcriptional regulator [Paenibacillus sp. P96]|uniref:YafY family transcriptional regulator n=1 Tax=Paenibacillus zeirhizosphaerae TaxID=2987519 RepID=A0ABT9FUW8_9BACL|nr:YafY family protein [Paenibacillus sp. P96]MDP4098524.1 YafY family transcriptional regulator [Paenibacillus sp. P96]